MIIGYVHALLLHFLAWIAFFFCFRWLWAQVGISVLVVLSLSLAIFSNGFTAQSFQAFSGSRLLVLSLSQITKAMCIGLPLAIALECFPFAGRLSDVSRGTQFAEQALGSLAPRSSILEGLAEMLVLLVIFPLGGFQLIANDLILLFAIDSSHEVSKAVWNEFFLRVLAESYKMGLFLALPVMIAGISLDVCIVCISRNIGRINLNFELMGLRACVGMLLVFLLLSTSSTHLSEYFSMVIRDSVWGIHGSK